MDAEVAIKIVVEDRYAWYVNDETGNFDKVMAYMEMVGSGENFPISGVSSPIIGTFNLNDKTKLNDNPYYEITIDE